MEGLTQRIRERLRTGRVCRVFSNELTRVWPPGPKEQAERYKRMKAITEYAHSQGWSVTVRDAGLEATFRVANQG